METGKQNKIMNGKKDSQGSQNKEKVRTKILQVLPSLASKLMDSCERLINKEDILNSKSCSLTKTQTLRVITHLSLTASEKTVADCSLIITATIGCNIQRDSESQTFPFLLSRQSE